MKRFIGILVALSIMLFAVSAHATWLGDFLKAGIDPRGGELTISKDITSSGNFTFDNTLTGANGSLEFFTTSENVTNGSSVNLPNATNGVVWLSDGTNAALTHVEADASLLEIAEAGTVEVTDIGTTLAIIDGGTQASIKNRTGSNATISVIYFIIP